MTHTVFTLFLRFLVLVGLFFQASLAIAGLTCVTGTVAKSNTAGFAYKASCTEYVNSLSNADYFFTWKASYVDKCIFEKYTRASGVSINTAIATTCTGAAGLYTRTQVFTFVDKVTNDPIPEKLCRDNTNFNYDAAATNDNAVLKSGVPSTSSGNLRVWCTPPPYIIGTMQAVCEVIYRSDTTPCDVEVAPEGSTPIPSVCPLNQVMTNGVCMTPTPVCVAPQTLVNGVCTTPTTPTNPTTPTTPSTPTTPTTGTSSTFSGSCDSSFVCSGDAATCAIAKAASQNACDVKRSMGTDTADPTTVKGMNAIQNGLSGAKAPGEIGGLSVTTTSIAGLDTSNPLGSACPPDYPIQIFTQLVLIPLSKLCSIFQILGAILVGLASLSAAFIITKGL